MGHACSTTQYNTLLYHAYLSFLSFVEMTDKKYTVVEFLDGAMAAVHSTWVEREKTGTFNVNA